MESIDKQYGSLVQNKIMSLDETITINFSKKTEVLLHKFFIHPKMFHSSKNYELLVCK